MAILGVASITNAVRTDANKDLINDLTVLGLLVAPPVIHVANGDPRKIGYWALVVGGGFALGYVTLQTLSGLDHRSADERNASDDSGKILSVSLLVGLPLASMVDALFLAWKRVPIQPLVAPTMGGAVVGVGGRF